MWIWLSLLNLELDRKLRILKFVFKVEYDFDSVMRLEPKLKMDVGLKSRLKMVLEKLD